MGKLRLALLALLTLPLLAAINDPAADIEDAAERKAARIAVWQPAWEGFTADQKANFAYDAFFDWTTSCRGAIVPLIRQAMGDPEATAGEMKAWIKSEFSVLALNKIHGFLAARGCASGGGGGAPVVIVASTLNAARAFRRRLPFLPRITGAAEPLYMGTPNVGGDGRVAWGHRFPPAQLHLLEAIIRAEGAGAQFQMLDRLPEDWQPMTE